MKILGIAGTVMLSFSAMLKMMHLPLAGIILTLGSLCLAFLFLPLALLVLRKDASSGNNRFLFVAAFIAGSFLILGILFKIQHWPGAGLILTVSLVTGLLIFIPSLLLNKMKQKENRAKLPVYITAAGSLGIYIAGLFFRINHWPLSDMMMSVGAVIILFVAFPWYVWITWKDEDHLAGKFLFMAISLIAIILPAVLLNIRNERSFEDGFFDHQERQVALYNLQKERNNIEVMVSQYQIAYRGIKELHGATADLIGVITEMEVEMVRIAEGDPGNPSNDPPQLLNSGDAAII